MLSFTLSLTVKPGCEEQAIATLSEIDRLANTHAGVLTFKWFQHLDEPRCFRLLEQWDTQDHLDAHIAKIIDLWNAFGPCLDGDAHSDRLQPLVS